ncbi:MAG TPA: glycosyltransferase family 39 protein [Bryobacteraceae bacterium]|nr:glycosyltransferase family 39 protein [Bryobacteraceae bacterium]
MAPTGKEISDPPEIKSIPAVPPRWRGWTTWDKWVFAAVVALFIVARLYHIAAICLDGDEIFSVGVSSKSWSALTAAAGADSIHPPLFYYILKLWMYLGGDSLFWVRLLPALFCILAIVPSVLLAREFRLRPGEISGVIGIAAIHPFVLYYSQHVRMYTLLMLSAVTSLWVFHRAIRGGTKSTTTAKFVQLTLVNIVMVHSQYYGWLVVGLECLYLLLWKRSYWKQAAISVAVTFVAFCPWLYVAAKYAVAKGGLASNLEWIQKPSVGDLTWFFVDLAGFSEFPEIGPRAVAGLGLLVVAMAIAAWVNRRDLRSRRFAYMTRYLSFFLLGTVGISFGASHIMKSSIWGHRHMIYLSIPFLMMVVCAYSRLPARAVRITGALLCAVWAFLAVQHHIKGDDKKTPFDTLVVEILDQEKATTGQVKFFSVDKYLHYPVWFYLETLKAGKRTGFAAPIRDSELGALAKEAARIEVKSNVKISDLQGSHFWVGYSSAWNEKKLPQDYMAQRGCRTGPDVKVRDRFHSETIFPVWCGS